MALYFFDIYNDITTTDTEGLEFADAEAAMARAVIEARHLAAASVMRGHLVGHHRIEVLGADRKSVGAVRFDQAVDIN